MQPAIEIRALAKRFGKKTVVDDLNLAVPAGAIYALLGDNGAGKTTTIRMLLGLLPADSGMATILGRDSWRDAARLRTRVGYVPERPKFYDWMTVSEIGWFTSGFHTSGYFSRYQDLADQFQLSPKAKLQTLSKGQYAKVALALALAVDPEVLILDEPTSGLDLFVRREFLGSMVSLAEQGKTILISSHQVAEIERVASHVAFMAQGKLLFAGTMDELRERLIRIRLRFETSPPDPAGLGTILERNGSGKLWQVVVRDPVRQAIEALRTTAGIADFEEASIPLEEAFTVLLGKKEVQS
jgi:ABC-2 type transport system ATP-binding protein